MCQLHRVNRQLIDANWQRIKNSGGPFLKGPASSYGQFEAFLSQAAFAVELDYGLIPFDRTNDRGRLQAHGFFWSHQVFRHTKELRSMFDNVMLLMDVRRVEIIFPVHVKGIHAILNRMEFEHEGTLRAYFKWSGEVYDASIYSLTKVEE